MHQSSSPQYLDRKRSTLDAACIDVRKPRDGGPIVEDISEKRHPSMKAHKGINHSDAEIQKGIENDWFPQQKPTSVVYCVLCDDDAF